ncbi:MAG: carboxypeptidase-like regulatory domain-containing protein, partial [Acidobacteriia bacterium]|nr:carboxypeptidase-like regulatory domain-containing protein [Terriglobia bacterium]
MLRFRLAVLAGFFLLRAVSFGQAGRAELLGTILDPSGLAVPKAKVEAEDQATRVHYSATAEGNGEYHILGLPAGQYVVTVEQPGFRTYRQSGIVLRLAERATLDVK